MATLVVHPSASPSADVPWSLLGGGAPSGVAANASTANAHRLCPPCAWTVALDLKTADAELTALAPPKAERRALRRHMTDPMILARICARILENLAKTGEERDHDEDWSRWAPLLGHVTAHRPALLVDEVCADGCCDHGADECYGSSTIAACPACSIQAGSWAGEWAGRYEYIVPAPCSVLLTMAQHFGVGPVGPDVGPGDGDHARAHPAEGPA